MGKHLSKLKEILKSPHLQIALATGVSIIVMAYFSKRILPKPISYLSLAIPPFIESIYEVVAKKYKDKIISTTWYWVITILFATVLIIVLNII
jgi:hypothetical protein